MQATTTRLEHDERDSTAEEDGARSSSDHVVEVRSPVTLRVVASPLEYALPMVPRQPDRGDGQA